MPYKATGTVKGGMFETNGVASLDSIANKGSIRQRIAQLFGRKQLLALRELATTLDGAAAGSTASKTYSRVEANSELGGKRNVESVSLVNRVTASADVTEIEDTVHAFTTKTSFGANPPDNLDGNPLGTR